MLHEAYSVAIAAVIKMYGTEEQPKRYSKKHCKIELDNTAIVCSASTNAHSAQARKIERYSKMELFSEMISPPILDGC